MIDLYNGELLDMLPCQMSKEIEQICLSHALKKGIQLVMDRAYVTRTQAFSRSAYWTCWPWNYTRHTTARTYP